VSDDIPPELLDILRDERDRTAQRIDFLSHDRDSIAAYLQAGEGAGERRTAAAASAWRARPRKSCRRPRELTPPQHRQSQQTRPEKSPATGADREPKDRLT
jgi:hypothetical protein